MKNGAVDFICKDYIFHEDNQHSHKKLLTDKVRRAAGVIIRAKEPVSTPSPASKNNQKPDPRVVFCEECGQQEVVTLNKRSNSANSVICTHCGDSIDLNLSARKQFRRNTFITVIGGGEGSFANLLQIIPQLEPEMGGAIIVVIHAVTEHLNNFTEYLDAISEMEVIRARNGITIEGGNCYIASGQEYMRLKPYTAQLTLQKMQKESSDKGAIDVLLTSASIIMKKRLAGVILSGLEKEGDRGIDTLIGNGGVPVMLAPEECYCKQMSQRILVKCHIPETFNSLELVEKIKTLHYNAKIEVVAG
jgi:two-component system chemotaxis response regulator CheB